MKLYPFLAIILLAAAIIENSKSRASGKFVASNHMNQIGSYFGYHETTQGVLFQV